MNRIRKYRVPKKSRSYLFVLFLDLYKSYSKGFILGERKDSPVCLEYKTASGQYVVAEIFAKTDNSLGS